MNCKAWHHLHNKNTGHPRTLTDDTLFIDDFEVLPVFIAVVVAGLPEIAIWDYGAENHGL
jgi:hypothetical protein